MRSAFSRLRLGQILGWSETGEDVYPLLNWPLTVRIGGVLWLLGAAAVAGVLPYVSPTHVLGSAGWPILDAILALAVMAGIWMLARGRGMGPRALLVMGYGAAAGLGIGQMLMGSPRQFDLAFLLVCAYQAFIQPVRRLLPLLGWAGVCQVASSLIARPSGLNAVYTISALVLISLMSLVVVIQAHSARAANREMGRLRGDAERRAAIDPLTGLGNRRALDDVLARQVVASIRYGRPLSVLMVDVDDFKLVNDEFGHARGDDVLIAVAGAIRGTVRGADAAFRWGGDEFVVLLEVDVEEAATVAERISQGIVRTARLLGDLPVSVSCGWAALDDFETGPELLQRADARLYEAKRRLTEVV